MHPEDARIAAASLTIAATQNLTIPEAIRQDSQQLAEMIVQTYEAIYLRLTESKVVD